MELSKRVAVLMQDGVPADFSACTQAAVFSKESGEWRIDNEIPYSPASLRGAEEMRDSVRSLILELGDCSVVIARRLQGLPYHVFDRMGFSIFEADTLSDALLDAVFSDISAAEEQDAHTVPTAPVPKGAHGRYQLDLCALQQYHPEVSSKQALRPFLQSTPFTELRLICSHQPPWLLPELQQKHCRLETHPLTGERMELIVTHTCH